jgi:hypothetical protein
VKKVWHEPMYPEERRLLITSPAQAHGGRAYPTHRCRQGERR